MLRTTKMGIMKKMAICWIGFVLVGLAGAKVTPKISCDDENMTVELTGPNLLDAYLKGLKNYPELSCLPHRSENSLRFVLSLKEFSRCGTSQILNKITGSLIFYNRIIVIDREGKDTEIMAKCKLEGELSTPLEVGDNSLPPNNGTLRRRRDVLPAGFEEQEDPIYPRNYEELKGYGPEPILTMVVKQEGRTIGHELLVTPGAPLTMEVSHIERCIQPPCRGDVYGIIVSRLDVTDTQDQSEVILVNGCTVDPYLFENFATADGDTLSAKFRAFKFPDSTYVLFQGTINVCLGTCRPSQCSNGQIGYGRRRRSLMSNNNMASSENNANDIYVYRVNTLLRIENVHSGLDDGTILYRPKRLNPDHKYRLIADDGDILALTSTNGANGSSHSSYLGVSLLVIAIIQRCTLSLLS